MALSAQGGGPLGADEGATGAGGAGGALRTPFPCGGLTRPGLAQGAASLVAPSARSVTVKACAAAWCHSWSLNSS